MRVVPYGTLGVAAVCTFGWVGACEDGTPALPCVDAPATGCPEDYGADACRDPACSAVYTCDNGKWVFVRACSSADAAVDATGARDSGAPGDVVTADGAAAPIDASAGAFGGAGCISLEPPDCPLGVALACKSSDCCGCQDLFVCADGGWSAWGACVDGAVVAP